RPEHLRHLGKRPDIELAFLPFGVSVERGAERTLRRGHLTCEPADRLVCARTIQRFAGALMRKRQKLQQLRVVIEHFLEMRHQPALIDRVASEAAAEMIIDAALRDALERELDRVAVARLAGALAGTPEKLEQHRLRKLRRSAGAAVDRVDDAAQPLRGA